MARQRWVSEVSGVGVGGGGGGGEPVRLTTRQRRRIVRGHEGRSVKNSGAKKMDGNHRSALVLLNRLVDEDALLLCSSLQKRIQPENPLSAPHENC
ncbi:hypothetical protein Q1695_003926 [Nippostrongylus brasiliensis]|nr:hypothetical protein Q1695_003926 [Nippostrongylus brasiliensis]